MWPPLKNCTFFRFLDHFLVHKTSSPKYWPSRGLNWICLVVWGFVSSQMVGAVIHNPRSLKIAISTPRGDFTLEIVGKILLWSKHQMKGGDGVSSSRRMPTTANIAAENLKRVFLKIFFFHNLIFRYHQADAKYFTIFEILAHQKKFHLTY